MRMSEFQAGTAETDTCGSDEERGRLVALLGLAGEAAGLLSEYKKVLRDGQSDERFKLRAAEELGDVLWYVASVARRLGLDLDEIAKANQAKTVQRFGKVDANGRRIPRHGARLFDERYEDKEKLPRRFEARWESIPDADKPRVRVYFDGEPFGDELNDNAFKPDGFRYHDALHFGFGACLGWSPQLRSFLSRKRRSRPEVDENEDGARARFIEEAVVVLIHTYAQEHDDLVGVSMLDSTLLQTIRRIVQPLEVGVVTEQEWEQAILASYSVLCALRDAGGGRIVGDMAAGTIEYVSVD